MFIPRNLSLGVGKTHYSRDRSHGLDIHRLICKAHFPLGSSSSYILEKPRFLNSGNCSWFPINDAAYTLSSTIRTGLLDVVEGDDALDVIRGIISESSYGCACNSFEFKYRHHSIWNFEKLIAEDIKDPNRRLGVISYQIGQGVCRLVGVVVDYDEHQKSAAYAASNAVEGSGRFLAVRYVVIDGELLTSRAFVTDRRSCWWIDVEEEPFTCMGFQNPRLVVEDASASIRAKIRSRLASSVATLLMELSYKIDVSRIPAGLNSDVLGVLEDRDRLIEVRNFFKTLDNEKPVTDDAKSFYDLWMNVEQIGAVYSSCPQKPTFDSSSIDKSNNIVYQEELDSSVVSVIVNPITWQLRLGDGVILDSLNAFRYAKSEAYLSDRVPEDLMIAITEAQAVSRYLAFYAVREGDGFSKIDLRSQMSGETLIDYDDQGRINEIYVSDRKSDRKYLMPFCVHEGSLWITHRWDSEDTVSFYVFDAERREMLRIEANVKDLDGFFDSIRAAADIEISEVSLLRSSDVVEIVNRVAKGGRDGGR